MSAINIVFHHGPQTFKVAEKVTGGQVLALNNDGLAVVAAADAESVIGIAHTDAAPRQKEYASLQAVPLPEFVGAVYAPAAVWLETTGTVTLGGAVGVAGAGKVKAHSAGAVVGKVTEIKGSRALVRLAV
ncbi:hypothetical protein BJF89_01005 [Corynebacterium sp. CNJ-954]|uniref:hypothetical protein n=1 Tax=Corynebacterium sp. CNJ-954 TaxID=1904962 RepID=UPI000966141C|nr:hypothetical protein [Corynebacterium sp. CNJ-954]OLT54842.1 hypothetical protein BJF89_01005 [Corynebacterium sp. CNJ-954]